MPHSRRHAGSSLKSLSYNAEGALTSDATGSQAVTYTLRRAGGIGVARLGGVEQANYAYEGFQRLIKRTIVNGATPGAIRMTWDIFGHVLSETVDATTVRRDYVWLGDMPIAMFESGSPERLYYVHTDHLDRPVTLTSTTQTVRWRAS